MPKFAKNRYKSLPIFGEKFVAKTTHTVRGKQIPDTIYHQVPDLQFVNQKGDRLSWKNYQGKIIVINLFYTKSPITQVNASIADLAEYYKKNALVHFISLNIDPKDSLAQISAFADQQKAKAGKWDLVTADTAMSYPFIRKGLLLDVVAVKGEQSKFIYGNQILLLDNQHRIRGFYEATNAEAVAKLDDEIKVLIAEDLRNIKDGR
ncbi:SCO family protein [Pedobacter sp. AW1-32]|uniref:SCO family protein n=1 Tax=Pedobacter sp. AW1-32 TaxID=3383026 RepID=UPI003FF0B154